MAKARSGASSSPADRADEDDRISIEDKKGRPTPTRKEQEALNKRPLVPKDRRAAAKRSREQMREQRERARAGMAAGDDRYLTHRDKGPQRRFVRDYVDARFSVGELLMPLMLVVIVMTFTPNLNVQFVGTILLWVFLVLTIIDSLLLGATVRKRLAAKYGEGKVEKGLRLYAAMRAVQFRAIRLPKPQVRRREFPA